MTRKAYIAVDMRGDGGKEPVFELIIDGVKQCELSAIEALELGLNATSAVRWAIPRKK